jgi:hypothetical protein
VFCAKVRLSGQSDDKTTHQGDGETDPEQETDKIKSKSKILLVFFNFFIITFF